MRVQEKMEIRSRQRDATSGPAVERVAGFMRWVEWLLPALCLALVAVMAIFPLAATDLWWQLKTGELIWTHHAVPHRDVFSHPAAGHPWYVQEWLAELFLYGLYHAFAPGALVLYRVIGPTLAFALVYWRCRLRSGSAVLAAAITALAAYAARPLFDMRPQLFTFIWFALTLLLLEQWRRGAWPRAIWLLPAVTLLWVNVHGGYILMLVLLGVELVEEALGPEGRRQKAEGSGDGTPAPSSVSSLSRLPSAFCLLPSGPRWRTLLAVTALCGLAALVNPQGWETYHYPFLLIGHRGMVDGVVEWLSPNFQEAQRRPLCGLLLLLAVAPVVPRRSGPRDFLLLAGLLHGMLFSRRHVALFAIGAAPILAEAVAELCARATEGVKGCRGERVMTHRSLTPSPLHPFTPSVAAVAMAIVLATALVTQVRQLPRGHWFETCVRSTEFPARACDFLLQQPQGARLYNDYGWGGYCIWRLWPQYRVFIDGRAEVYFDSSFADFDQIQALRPGWEDRLRRWQVETVLTASDSVLGDRLKRCPGWQRIYEDHQALVLRRVAPRLAAFAGAGSHSPSEVTP